MSTAVWVGYPQGNIPMADGFGGTLAAPIWNEYMHAASGGYCGDWRPPDVPFEGTAFFGPFATTGKPVTAPQSTNTSSSSSTTTTPSGGTGVANGTSTTQYNNPTLYQHPPQSGSGTNSTPPPAHNPPSGTGGSGATGPVKH
jgi:membrane peptidoglycan carboxypeptidase